MDVLTIRPTRRQRVYLALVASAFALVASAILAIRYASGAKLPGRPVGWAVAAAVGAVGVGWVLLRYARAITECTPTGLHSRGVGREWRCSWKDVHQIAIRTSPYPRGPTMTYTVLVTTTSGDELHVWSPVAGGILPDPDFEAKVRKIRAYWQLAIGTDPTAVASGPVPVDPGIWALWNRWRLRPLFRLLVEMTLLAAIVTVPFTIRASGPAMLARLGYGQRGYFIASATACDNSCYWVGDFHALKGAASRPGVAIGQGAAITHSGQRVAAVSTGSGRLVYPAGGGADWLALGIPLLVIACCLLPVIVWTVRWHRLRSQLIDYRPDTAAQANRSMPTVWAGAVTLLMIMLLTIGGVAAYGSSQLIPLGSAARTVACADYTTWLLAQPDTALPKQEPQLLVHAARETPGSQLGTDLATLQSDVTLTLTATSTDETAADEASLTTDLQTLNRDCGITQ